MPKAVEEEVIIEAFVEELAAESFSRLRHQVFRPPKTQKPKRTHDRIRSFPSKFVFSVFNPIML